MINKVILIGNLGRDPEVRHLENNSVVAKFPIATNESYLDKSGEWQTQTEWHDIVVWRGLAERAERDLKKGSLVYVEGKLTHRKYQDKDGIDRYVTEVVGRLLRPLERRESSSSGYGDNFPSAINTSSSETSSVKEPSEEILKDIPNDDLPF